MKRNAGIYLTSSTGPEPFQTFIPSPLPPEPPLELTPDLRQLLETANRALGRLDGTGIMLSDIGLFRSFSIRKEALLSSQIEGTQSSFADLLLYESHETPGVPLDDVEEVSSCLCGCCAKCMKSCCPRAGAVSSPPASSGAPKTGLEAPAPATPAMFRPRPTA